MSTVSMGWRFTFTVFFFSLFATDGLHIIPLVSGFQKMG
jgi:hypothetical protein